MNATIEINNEKIDIYHATFQGSGHGHKLITVELYWNGTYKEFTAVTSNMSAFDEARELVDNLTDYYLALYNIISYKIEDNIIEWINEN